MCTESGLSFIQKNANKDEIFGKTVIEIGARNVNGSCRSYIESLKPSSYLGTDIQMGPCVDEICYAENLLKRYGKERFDILISLECIEHIKDWQEAISNFKNILKPNGCLYLTTRSKLFPYHGFPYDFWRFELDDMSRIFSDLGIEILEKDNGKWDGVFIKAKKPSNFVETDLSPIRLYSAIKKKRLKNISNIDVFKFRCIYNFKKFVKTLITPN
ncbi:MAG: class I SAM-dependent methyltransferase [Candidatus Omnitrophota bacterium]